MLCEHIIITVGHPLSSTKIKHMEIPKPDFE